MWKLFCWLVEGVEGKFAKTKAYKAWAEILAGAQAKADQQKLLTELSKTNNKNDRK
jgi:hypothetical protein